VIRSISTALTDAGSYPIKMLLKLLNIKKTFRVPEGRKTVIDGLSLELDRGEIVSVTGSSGCGKTTLLNIISGLIPPDTGSVCSDGEKISGLFDFNSSKRRNRDIGFIFQTFRLIPDETVLSNILLPARIRGHVTAQTRDYADELMGSLRIYKYKKNRTSNLSGGQKQRVAIARALVNRPSLVLADEPSANLDVRTSSHIFDVIESLKVQGRGVLIVTHKDYMHERSDHIYKMEMGKLRKMR